MESAYSSTALPLASLQRPWSCYGRCQRPGRKMLKNKTLVGRRCRDNSGIGQRALPYGEEVSARTLACSCCSDHLPTVRWLVLCVDQTNTFHFLLVNAWTLGLLKVSARGNWEFSFPGLVTDYVTWSANGRICWTDSCLLYSVNNTERIVLQHERRVYSKY